MRKPISSGHWANVCNEVESGARYKPYILSKRQVLWHGTLGTSLTLLFEAQEPTVIDRIEFETFL